MSPNHPLSIRLGGTWTRTRKEIWIIGGLWCRTRRVKRQLGGYRGSLSPAFRIDCLSPILARGTLISTDLGGAVGSFLRGCKLHTHICFLLLISLLPVQISQGVGAFPGSSRLWGTIQVFTAATGWNGRLSLGFSQPKQVESFQGGFDEEASRELCALVLTVLLQSLC